MTSQPTQSQAQSTGITSEEAARRAGEALGLGETDRATAQVRLEVLDSEVIPFLGKDLADKQTWVVKYPNIHLKVGDAGRENPYIHRLTVVMAPEAGQILSIRSEWPAGEPLMAPFRPLPNTKGKCFRAPKGMSDYQSTRQATVYSLC